MLHCQRDAFQLPADAHYLNCAFMSPLMRSVENAGVEGIRQKRNPADIRPADFFDEVNRVRGLFAQLIKAGDPTRVAVVPSASYGLTAAARNLPMAAGQTVVVAAGQMPSNMYCWRRIATERQGHVYTVAVPVGGHKTFTEAIINAIDDPVCVEANVHRHLGAMQTLPRMTLAVTRYGSHCGFFDRPLAGGSWSERAIAEYLRTVHQLL